MILVMNKNFKGKEENDSQDYNVSERNSNTDKSTNTNFQTLKFY
jgi:hypothetical protein